MHDKPELREWVGYDATWLIIGSSLIVMLVAWYGFVWFVTRKKKQRTLATLQPKPYTPPDLTSLKAKYYALITEIEDGHRMGELSARQAHQKLSYLLRMFAYETRGHRIDTLTLADLKKTRYQELAGAIEKMYLPEFALVQTGNVDEAIEIARKVVMGWN